MTQTTTFKDARIGTWFIHAGVIYLKDSASTALHMPSGTSQKFKPDTQIEIDKQERHNANK